MTIEQNMTALSEEGKVILAADESPTTMNGRLEKVGIVNPTETHRRAWRQLIITTPGLSNFVAGIILHPETLSQATTDGRPFTGILRAAGIKTGVKVDTGLEDFGKPGEQTTKGLEGLPARLQQYAAQGAAFAKWRAVYKITDETPSDAIFTENAKRLAAYAKASQDAGLIPIVEPEVLMDGDHSFGRNLKVTEYALAHVSEQLLKHGVNLTQIILKPNMVTEGASYVGTRATPNQVAAGTLLALAEIPIDVPMIAFLSGGQPEERVNANLMAINQNVRNAQNDGQRFTGSFGRSLLNAALNIWKGNPDDVGAGQRTILGSTARASMASQGRPIGGPIGGATGAILHPQVR